MSRRIPSPPLAALDVGSNTIHLVVARVSDDGRDLRTLADELDLTRLGADISATGAISPDRMQRAITVLRAQKATADRLGAARLLALGTEGVRAASNSEAFLQRIRGDVGIDLTVVDGAQEAALTYWGATSGLPATDARRAVLDLGGGSLEIVTGEGMRVTWRVSLPLGSGAVHDRYAPADPADAAQLVDARRAVVAELAAHDVPRAVDEVIACGGTATSLVALASKALRVPEPAALVEPRAVGTPALDDAASANLLGTLSMDDLAALIGVLEAEPAAALAARYNMQEARVRLLAAGATALGVALERLGVNRMRVNRRGIREGAILAYAHFGDGWLDAAEQGMGW